MRVIWVAIGCAGLWMMAEQVRTIVLVFCLFALCWDFGCVKRAFGDDDGFCVYARVFADDSCLVLSI